MEFNDVIKQFSEHAMEVKVETSLLLYYTE